jgi:hypothetical protein
MRHALADAQAELAAALAEVDRLRALVGPETEQCHECARNLIMDGTCGVCGKQVTPACRRSQRSSSKHGKR